MAYRSLSVTLTADTAPYSAALREAAAQTKTFGTTAEVSGRQAQAGYEVAAKGATTYAAAATEASVAETRAAEKAEANVAKKVAGNAALKEQAAQYQAIAASAEAGSEKQIAANRLLEISNKKLAASGLEVQAATKATSGTAGALEKDLKGLLGQVTSLGPGTSALSGHFGSLSTALGGAKSNLAGVTKEGSGLAAALPAIGAGVAGIGIAVAGFAVASVGKFIAVAGEVNKLRVTLGSSAEDASRFRNVAIGLGVDVDTMGKAFFKLGPILEKTGGDLAGIHVEIAKNADGSSNLVATIDNMRKAYAGIADPIQKAQFLQEAFKKTGLDLRPILAANAEQFNKLANTGPIIHQADIDKAKELAIAQRELKQKLEDVQVTFASKVIPAYENADHALYKFLEKTRLFIVDHDGFGVSGKRHAEIVNNIANAYDKGKGSAAAFAEKEKEVEAATKAAAKALEELATAQEGLLDKSLALEHGQNALERSTADSTKAHQEAQKAVEQYGRASDEADAAITRAIDSDRSLKDATIAVAKETRDVAVAHEIASGRTVTATESVQILIRALRDQASKLAPGSELRSNLEAYAKQLETGIPRDVNTVVTADTSQAKAEIADLERRLAYLANKGVSIANDSNRGTAGDPGPSSSPSPSSSSPPSSDSSSSADSARGNILGHGQVVALAAGGRTSGFITAGPQFLVGEGNPRYKEAVIATDPQYHDRNVKIWEWAGRELGVRGAVAGAGPMVSDSLDGGINYATLAATLAPVLVDALSASPSRAYVVASDVAAGLNRIVRR